MFSETDLPLPRYLSEHHDGAIRGSASNDRGSLRSLSGARCDWPRKSLGFQFYLQRDTSESAFRAPGRPSTRIVSEPECRRLGPGWRNFVFRGRRETTRVEVGSAEAFL